MFKLIFSLAFVSLVLGNEYPEYQSLGSGKYFISKDKLTYHQAFAACKMNGWTLAIEQKPEDTKALDKELLNSKSAAEDFWIGGYLYDDTNLAPEWIWLDVGDVMEYKNWVGKQPDGKRHCLLKTQSKKSLGKWVDGHCRDEHHYICRVP